mmetsp:Transcript_106510/g.185271  ORF Transcript_106510/g.185271 Transcript_106510/m.185271 type:complete len:206 (+) Transcript_106510:726-1343(+)
MGIIVIFDGPRSMKLARTIWQILLIICHNVSPGRRNIALDEFLSGGGQQILVATNVVKSVSADRYLNLLLQLCLLFFLAGHVVQHVRGHRPSPSLLSSLVVVASSTCRPPLRFYDPSLVSEVRDGVRGSVSVYTEHRLTPWLHGKQRSLHLVSSARLVSSVAFPSGKIILPVVRCAMVPDVLHLFRLCSGRFRILCWVYSGAQPI